MAKYDEEVLEKYASRLYARARLSILLNVIAGCVLGGIIGDLPEIIWFWTNRGSPPPKTATIFGVFIGALIFAVIGDEKAFKYRLLAQTTLCQAQIERNTRRNSSL